MACSVSRTGWLTLAALVVVAFGASAGELFRPVPPDAQVTRFNRFNIRYTLRDIIAGSVEKVEFFITEDMGRTWSLYGEDHDRVSPMTVQVPGEGVYGFVCVATDRFGNREREPGPRTRPETVIVVDRTPPSVKWIAPLQDVLARSNPIEFQWEAGDSYLRVQPVRIQYAHNAQSNQDRDAAWQDLHAGLPAVGTITWTPPADTSGRYNFRLIAEDRAGNLGIAYNPATFIMDTVPPTITGVQPLRSNQLRANLTISAEDDPGGSGVKEISLYSSENGGVDWTLLKERSETGESVPVRRPPDMPVPFEVERSGEYALWPVAFDNAENGSPLPSGGIPGPYVLVVDNEPPSVTLSNSFLQGRSAILTNETRVVEWTSYDPHPKEGTAAIYLSHDNGRNWQLLESGRSSSGSAVVNFAYGSTSDEAMLKVSVEDDFGNVGEGLSQSFRLANADTTITGVAPAGPGYPPPYGADYQPFDSSGVTMPAPPSPYGQPSDPYGTYQTPPPASDPYANYPPYGSPYDTYQTPVGSPVGESTAGSFPSAMLGAPAMSSRQPDLPPPPAAQARPAPAWNPTPAAPAPSYQLPDAGSATTSVAPGYFDAPDSGFSSPTTPAAPASPWGDGAPPVAPPPPPPAGGIDSQAPPFPSSLPDAGQAFTPSAPVAPVAPPPATQEDSAGLGIAPPPLPGASAAPAAPQAPSMDDFFSNFGTDLQPPPLPSERAGAAASPAPSLPPAPAAPVAPVAPPSMPVAPPSVAPPAAPTIPAITPPISPAGSFPFDPSGITPPPSQPPPIPGMADEFSGSIAAPPAPGGSPLPSDPRQLSNRYADEARDYLEEGRVDLALEAATRALNADNANPLAYSRLAQAYVQQDPPNFARAATLAKEATDLGMDWYSWWTCADVFYRWSHARNRMVQTQMRGGQRPSADLLDERNQALNNAQIAIGNAGKLVRPDVDTDMEQVALTQGEITYLRALSIPEPIRPAADAPPSTQAEYRNSFTVYKNSVTPILLDALPHFQTALRMGGAPSYREAFHLGIINFRLGGLEKDTGNATQSATYYETAARYLEEATTAVKVPAEGPREAYYMLAYSHDQLAEQPGRDSTRQKELALRYWRRTADFYAPGSAYREFAERRIATLQQELGL